MSAEPAERRSGGTSIPPDDPGPSATSRRQLTVLPGGWQVPLPPGSSLLRAALDAGVRLPSSCRNGTCRSCLCRLLSGQVHYLIDWPGLLAEEKVDGWILPCVATADVDVVIDAPAATPLFG